MVESLWAISAEFAVYPWKFTKSRNKYITRFPSLQGLDHVVERTPIPCRNFNRWTGEEEDLSYIFSKYAWLSITGLPLHH